MGSSPPPPYQSQGQLLGSLAGAPPGYYSNVQPLPGQLPPNWPPPYQQQQIHDPPCLACLFKSCTCCFKGNRSTYMRYACVVLGALLLVHGVARVSVAGAAIPEAKVKQSRTSDKFDPAEKLYYPTIEFYNVYFISFMFLVSKEGTVGALLGTMVTAFLFEIFPGVCLIVAGVLLKPIVCALPVLSLILGVVEHVFDFVTVIRFVWGPFPRCQFYDCAPSIILVALLTRGITFTVIQFCLSVDVTLWQQIRIGLYAGNMIRQPQPPPLAGPPPPAEPVRETNITGEETESTAQINSPG